MTVTAHRNIFIVEWSTERWRGGHFVFKGKLKGFRGTALDYHKFSYIRVIVCN